MLYELISTVSKLAWGHDGRVDVSVVDEVADDLQDVLLGRRGELLGQRLVQHLTGNVSEFG